jgi:hypothetical protein
MKKEKEYLVKFYVINNNSNNGSLFIEKYLGNANHFKTKKEIFDEARLELAKIARKMFNANQVKKEFFDKYQSLKEEAEKTNYQDTKKFDLFCNQNIYDKNIFIDAEDIGGDHCHSFTIGDNIINNGSDQVFYKVFSRKIKN